MIKPEELDKEIKKYVTQTFSSMRHRSKRRGHIYPSFTKEELTQWLINNGITSKWDMYVKSGYNKKTKPSVDRTDDYKGYTFENMQLITWDENHKKGVNCIKKMRNCINEQSKRRVGFIDEYGRLASFNSVNECALFLGAHPTSVSRALTGKRKTIKKRNVIYLTGKELELKQ